MREENPTNVPPHVTEAFEDDKFWREVTQIMAKQDRKEPISDAEYAQLGEAERRMNKQR